MTKALQAVLKNVKLKNIKSEAAFATQILH